jgi:hypothetical protein
MSRCLSSHRRLGGFLVLLCLASNPGLARAQSPSATARVLFRDARVLMDKGRFDQACPKLEESLRLDHGMGTQFNLAHCWEQLGRTASAWGLFLDVAAAASAAGQPKRESAARARADAIEPKLSRVLIQVKDPAPGLVVTRGGEELGRGSWGTAVPVDPGTHAIEAHAPGMLPWATELEVSKPGETATLVIPALQAEKVDIPTEAPIAEGDEQPPEPADTGGGISTGRAVTSVVLAAVGVGGLVTGTIFGLKANSETAAAKELCDGGETGNVCDRDPDGGTAEQAELDEHREKADSAALISYIGWGVGAAGLISSAIVLLTAPDEAPPPEEAASLRIQPVFGPGFVGTGLSGTF